MNQHVILDKAFFKYSVNNSVGYNCMCRNTYKYIVLLPQACAFYGGIKCTHTITVTQTNMLPTSTEEHALKSLGLWSFKSFKHHFREILETPLIGESRPVHMSIFEKLLIRSGLIYYQKKLEEARQQAFLDFRSTKTQTDTQRELFFRKS